MKKNIIIVILIIALLGSVGYTVYDKVLKEGSAAEKEPSQEETTKETEEYLETTDQLVLDTMDKIDSALDYYCGTEKEYMKTEKVTVQDITNEFAYATVMTKLMTDTNSPVPASQLDKAIDETFGKDYQFEHKTYRSCPGYTYDAESGYYNFAGAECGGTCGPSNEKEIVKVRKTDKTLEIYERIVFANTDMSEGDKVAYCKDVNLEQVVGYLSSSDIQYNKEEVQKIVSKGSLYKFTFNLEDGTYVFVSSELQ